MRRLIVQTTVLIVGVLLASCGPSAATPAGVTPASTPSQRPSPSPSASATVEAAPAVVLLDKSGSGNYRSPAFTTRGEWDLVWEAASAPDTTGSFMAMTVFAGDGSPVAGTIMVDLGPPNSKKNDTVHMHYAGSVSVDIQAVGSWHIKAVGS